MFQRKKTNLNTDDNFTVCMMPELTRELIELESLLKSKYQDLQVNVSFGDTQVKVTLLNGRHGVGQGIDEENARPIEFLKSFGATITQEKNEVPHSYWSNSVAKFDESKLKQVIEGLKVLPNPSPEDSHGKMMARC